MVLYTHSITPRLQYILDFIAKELQIDPILITLSREEFNKYTGAKINYSDKRTADPEIWIIPHGLLFEKGLKLQSIECFEATGNIAFFKSEGDLSFRVVKGRDGNRRIRFTMPEADEVMFKVRGAIDGPRLVRVRRTSRTA